MPPGINDVRCNLPNCWGPPTCHKGSRKSYLLTCPSLALWHQDQDGHPLTEVSAWPSPTGRPGEAVLSHGRGSVLAWLQYHGCSHIWGPDTGSTWPDRNFSVTLIERSLGTGCEENISYPLSMRMSNTGKEQDSTNVPYKYSFKYANYYQQHSVITLIMFIGVTNLILLPL